MPILLKENINIYISRRGEVLHFSDTWVNMNRADMIQSIWLKTNRQLRLEHQASKTTRFTLEKTLMLQATSNRDQLKFIFVFPNCLFQVYLYTMYISWPDNLILAESVWTYIAPWSGRPNDITTNRNNK